MLRLRTRGHLAKRPNPTTRCSTVKRTFTPSKINFTRNAASRWIRNTVTTSSGMEIPERIAARTWFQSFPFTTATKLIRSQLPPMLSTNRITPIIISIDTRAKSPTARYGRQRTRNINIFLTTTFLMHTISTKRAPSEFLYDFFIDFLIRSLIVLLFRRNFLFD